MRPVNKRRLRKIRFVQTVYLLLWQYTATGKDQPRKKVFHPGDVAIIGFVDEQESVIEFPCLGIAVVPRGSWVDVRRSLAYWEKPSVN